MVQGNLTIVGADQRLFALRQKKISAGASPQTLKREKEKKIKGKAIPGRTGSR
jgi:hypothetical protein